MIERYRRWFQYEQDAHAKVLASLETVHAGRHLASDTEKTQSPRRRRRV